MGFLQPILLPIEQVLFEILKWLQSFVGDWGFAIILLTLFIRVLLIPLTWKQTQSMYEMQRIQPQLKALQEKYKNDKQKQQEEVLKFYQEHKVNPFGGCLPLLLQMPVFFALFGILGTARTPNAFNLNEYLSKAGQVANFWVLVPDISKTPQMVFSHAFTGGVPGFFAAVFAALPYLLLVVFFALSIWIPQQMMPGDKQQKMIGGYMAIFMLYFGWISPAGVLLYWVTSSIFQIGQQQITLKVMDQQKPAFAAAGAALGEGKAEPAEKPQPKKPQGSSKKSKKK